MKIKRGAICIDDHDRVFIVTIDSPRPISCGEEVTGEVWAGVLLVDGKMTMCVKPRFLAESFKVYLMNVASDVGIKSAEIEVAALRAEVVELRGRVL